MRSLETRNFFATDFLSWSTLWLVSTVTAKLPPVVVLMFSVIWLVVGVDVVPNKAALLIAAADDDDDDVVDVEEEEEPDNWAWVLEEDLWW